VKSSEKSSRKTTNKVEEKTKGKKPVTVIDSISYEVKPKETYSLSKCLT
jgi:hypothetical protein